MELYYRVSLHLNDKGQSMYRYNDLTINFNSMEVCVNEKPINLTNREYNLLTYLVKTRTKYLRKISYTLKFGDMIQVSTITL